MSKMYTKNFSKLEMACKCGTMCEVEMDQSFMEKLQRLRDEVGLPMIITSGARCAMWNKAVGGHPKSRHLAIKDQLWAKAADIACKDSDHRELILEAIYDMKEMGGKGIASTFIHVDGRGWDQGKVWTY